MILKYLRSKIEWVLRTREGTYKIRTLFQPANQSHPFTKMLDLIPPSATSTRSSAETRSAESTTTTAASAAGSSSSVAAASTTTIFGWVILHLARVFAGRRCVNLLRARATLGVFRPPRVLGLAVLLESDRGVTFCWGFWVRLHGKEYNSVFDLE